jgi:hypothetical protein
MRNCWTQVFDDLEKEHAADTRKKDAKVASTVLWKSRLLISPWLKTPLSGCEQ